MNKKHFVINEAVQPLSKDEIENIEKERTNRVDNIWKQREEKRKNIDNNCLLKHTFGRVIIMVDLQFKNQTAFADGTVIRMERQFNNFNRRETEPVNATVISANHIPPMAEILINHNALHDSNKIFDYKSQSPDIQYYSISEIDCYAWRDIDNELKPMKNFSFALRVYKPYEGLIKEISPLLIKDILYITTGEFKGNIVHTLKAVDYEIVFQGKTLKEERIIRLRHFEDEINEREEIIAISHELTEKLNKGKLRVGLSPQDAKTLN